MMHKESIFQKSRRAWLKKIQQLGLIAVAAPAVLNAIYRATGKRYRTVPLKNSGIKLV